MIAFTAIALPFLEIAGFVWLGGKLGVVLTLVWVIGAIVAGLALLRRTGLQAVGRLRAALAEGREPGHSIIDAACFAAAAMLLILPGFVSDALAVVLMLPITRHWLLRRTAAHFEAHVYHSTGTIHGEFTVVPDGDEDAPKDEKKPPPRIGHDRKIIDVE
ncbi:FxsA family protein [Dongia deserti]|uniref:FxsA family protein n=1 Tax=Dongia deserti TaxID=2268030 RepID=UPI0013C4B90C|nr:FxsA family protein [Dongia deserti]